MIPLAPESCPKRFFISELFFKPDGAPVSTAWEAATIIVRPETGLRIRPNRIFYLCEHPCLTPSFIYLLSQPVNKTLVPE